jgi:hypothetical protein
MNVPVIEGVSRGRITCKCVDETMRVEDPALVELEVMLSFL